MVEGAFRVDTYLKQWKKHSCEGQKKRVMRKKKRKGWVYSNVTIIPHWRHGIQGKGVQKRSLGRQQKGNKT